MVVARVVIVAVAVAVALVMAVAVVVVVVAAMIVVAMVVVAVAVTVAILQWCRPAGPRVILGVCPPAVGVAVPVILATVMPVSVLALNASMRVRVREGEHANQVDNQAHHGRLEQAVRVYLRGVEDALHALVKDVRRHKHKEQRVDETAKDLCACVAVRVPVQRGRG